jgi:trehalose 6-phosphate phosphatase
MARLHPEQVAERADRTALCLDYDGTLAPIVDDPEAAAPLPGTPELLGRLARRFAAVALVSGRPAAWLAGRAAAPGVRYLGLYGLEEIVDGRVVVASEAERVRPSVRAALRELAAAPAVTAAGAYVEDKGLSVGVHLRRVADPGRWAGPIEAAAATLPPATACGPSPASWCGSSAPRSASTRATRSAGWWPRPAPRRW